MSASIWTTYETADGRDWIVTGNVGVDGTEDIRAVRPDASGAANVDVDEWLTRYAAEIACVEEALWLAACEDDRQRYDDAIERRRGVA